MQCGYSANLPNELLFSIPSEAKGAAGLAQGLRRALGGQMLPFVCGIHEGTERTVIMDGYFLFMYDDELVFKKIRHS